MCIAAPMKIISIDREADTAEAESFGNILKINIALISPKIGDFVIVHAGCALEIVTKDTAGEIKELFDELGELYNEN